MTAIGGAVDRDSLARVRIATLGTVSWDELIQIDGWPDEGGFSYVRATESTPGGTTGNSTMAIRKLGAETEFFTVVGEDEPGLHIMATYRAAGVNVDQMRIVTGSTDVSYVLVSGTTSERTILWKQGPYLRRGDHINVDRLFNADVVLLDPIDLDLRAFLTDLPAHTRPRARILGPLSYLCETDPAKASEIALRHDVIVGGEREFGIVFASDDPEQAIQVAQERLTGTNCRLAIMTRGAKGSIAVDHSTRWECPPAQSHIRDTTGAGDAFAGAIAFGMAHRWEPQLLLAFAAVVSAAAIEHFGAQIGLPTLDEALDRLAAEQWPGL